MKTTRKFLAILMVIAMILSMGAFGAFADATASNTFTITAPSNDNVYEVYQIFTGDYDAASGKLSNVVWGKNGTGTLGATVTDAELKALTDLNTSDPEELETILTYVNLTSESMGTVTNGGTLSVPGGYYLIKDNGPVGNNETYSLYIVQVAESIVINPKADDVTSDKEVQEVNDSTTDAATWGEVADYDVGDAVPFKLTATLPSNYDLYTNGYKLTFHDTLSAGLSFNKESVVVKIDGATITTGYTLVEEPTDDCSFEVKFDNLTTTAAKNDSVITVEYTATLNENAVSGTTGNTNKSNVTYTNNPNDEQAGENGSTPDDTVIVFTYNVIVDKVHQTGTDDEGNPVYSALEGAGFTLYKYDTDATTDDKWVAVSDEIKGETTFSFNKLDEGQYKLVETTVPSGYNKAADIIFTVESTLTETEGSEALTALVVKDVTGAAVADFTVTLTSGNIETDVVNKAGSTLPETGGMGTALLIGAGSVLALAAAVFLVTKKRVKNAEC